MEPEVVRWERSTPNTPSKKHTILQCMQFEWNCICRENLLGKWAILSFAVTEVCLTFFEIGSI